MHDILMITYTRASYTRLALGRLLDSCDEQMRVWVWHNGTHAETLAAVEELRSHPRFHKLHISPENKRLREPTNWFWQNSDATYVTKVDDDCLLPDGWGGALRQVHQDNPKLGVIGCWRFYDEDFVPALARKKIVDLPGGHRLMANCWVQGSGYVFKRACIEELGPLRVRDSFPSYCVRAALRGWQNGWYYPFLHEEHMDDPRSPYCEIQTEEDFAKMRPLSAIKDGVHTLEDWRRRVRYMAHSAQTASLDPRQHSGWRMRVHNMGRRVKRLFSIPEPWQVNGSFRQAS